MNYEVYYNQKADGSYCIHFPNNEGSTLEEIEDMFSKYGKVVSVHNRGQARGLCFVAYRTIEEIKRAIEGFQSHNTIKILPQKRKINVGDVNKKSFDQEANNRHSSYSQQNAETRNFMKQKKSQNKTVDREHSINRSNSSASKLSYKQGTNLVEDNAMVDHSSDTSSISSRRFLSDNNSIKSCGRTSLPSKNDILQSMTKKKQHDCDVTNSRLASIESSKLSIDDIPALIYDQEVHNVRFPTLKSSYVLPIKCTVIPAQEVIVANVHINYGIHYILHLFEKYNPISVSLMKTTPRLDIRYCHVYFKTLQEALATEQEFDNYILRGDRLIVLCVEKLAEAALLL